MLCTQVIPCHKAITNHVLVAKPATAHIGIILAGKRGEINHSYHVTYAFAESNQIEHITY